MENSQNIKTTGASSMGQKEEPKIDPKIFEDDAINTIPLSSRLFSLTRIDSHIVINIKCIIFKIIAE